MGKLVNNVKIPPFSSGFWKKMPSSGISKTALGPRATLYGPRAVLDMPSAGIFSRIPRKKVEFRPIINWFYHFYYCWEGSILSRINLKTMAFWEYCFSECPLFKQGAFWKTVLPECHGFRTRGHSAQNAMVSKQGAFCPECRGFRTGGHSAQNAMVSEQGAFCPECRGF